MESMWTEKRLKLDNEEKETPFWVYANKLVSGYAKLFDVKSDKNPLSDVLIKVGNETFHCHKFVLQFCSDFFKSVPFEPGTVKVLDMNPDYFYEVLRFMYTGVVLVNTDNVESLLTATDLLGMDDLKNVCCRFVEDNLNRDNALLYWRLANKYKQAGVARKCQNQIARDLNQLNLVSSLMNVSEEIMKVILNDNDLEVKSEVEVCEILMKWLQVQTEAGHEVHPDQLLPLIRWSGVSVDYVKSKLLENKTLTSNPASVSFLSKVMTYLQTGWQFVGLRTIHRPSTGLENYLMVIEPGDPEVYRISLQSPEKVTKLTKIPAAWSTGYATCSTNNKVYLVGGGLSKKETWILDTSACWIQQWGTVPWVQHTDTARWYKSTDMLTNRSKHSAVIVDSMLYILGGVEINNSTTDEQKTILHCSVECYDTKTNKWSSAGQLIHAVKDAACVAYNNSIYVFGGLNEDNQPVAHVQVYNVALKICTLMDKPMPRACEHMRAVLWETSAILLNCDTCLIYNFETQTWLEKEQFKTGMDYFAVVLDNSTVYIGGDTERNEKRSRYIYYNDMKSMSVLDIIDDTPAVWKDHPKSDLLKAHQIHAYVNVALPSNAK